MEKVLILRCLLKQSTILISTIQTTQLILLPIEVTRRGLGMVSLVYV